MYNYNVNKEYNLKIEYNKLFIIMMMIIYYKIYKRFK